MTPHSGRMTPHSGSNSSLRSPAFRSLSRAVTKNKIATPSSYKAESTVDSAENCVDPMERRLATKPLPWYHLGFMRPGTELVKDHLKQQRAKEPDSEKAFNMKPVWIRTTVDNVYEVNMQEQIFKGSIKFEDSWWPLSQADFDQLKKLHEENGELDDDWVVDRELNDCSKLFLKNGDQKVIIIQCPRLRFINCIERTVDRAWFTIKTWTPDKPVLKWNIIFAGTFQEHMELGFFPLDKQPLKILVQAGWELQERDKRVWLMKNLEEPSCIASRRFVQSNQYKLDDRLIFRENYSRPDESSTLKTYSRLDIVMVVYRKPWFWFFNVIVPNFLITMSMLASYGVDYENLEGRCGITVTVLLALVAFRYWISDRTPEISYSTIMDYYMLLSFVFALAIIASQTLAKLGLNVRWSWSMQGPIMDPKLLGLEAELHVWRFEIPYEFQGELRAQIIAVPGPLCVYFLIWCGIHVAYLAVFMVHATRPWPCSSWNQRRVECEEEEEVKKLLDKTKEEEAKKSKAEEPRDRRRASHETATGHDGGQQALLYEVLLDLKKELSALRTRREALERSATGQSQGPQSLPVEERVSSSGGAGAVVPAALPLSVNGLTFNDIDANADGVITVNELQTVLERGAPTMSVIHPRNRCSTATPTSAGRVLSQRQRSPAALEEIYRI
jgi:hypothetical protein